MEMPAWAWWTIVVWLITVTIFAIGWWAFRKDVRHVPWEDDEDG